MKERYSAQLSGDLHVLKRRALSLVAKAPDASLALVAKEARANASDVSRYFHRDVGMTLVQYRTRRRLLRFIRLMDEGADNLLASAEAAGFGSYSQWHRSFQSQLGCSPRDYFHSGHRERMQQAYDP